MSENDLHAGNAPPGQGAAGTAPSFGATLAAAREAAGLSVGDVAARLRLHVNQVRALESENLARLPEAAYVRGFVRSYARMLAIDPAPLLDDLNGKVAPERDSVVDGMARARDYSPVRAAAQEQVSRWVVLGLAVLALIVLGLIGWYATRQSVALPSSAAPPPRAAAVQPAPMPAQPAVAVVPIAADSGGAGEGGSAPAAAESMPATEALASAMASESAAAEAPALLMLSFTGVSWVEVTDAKGNVIVSQLAQAGEVLRPAGTPPLAVVLGDAAKVSAAVRGEPFDLVPVTRSNIARFTVR
jgi:cytoskeleton protein RodZ